MNKFRISSYGQDIEAMNVTRETNCFVYYKGPGGVEERMRKTKAAANVFETWEAAHQCLVQRTARTVENLHQRLTKAENEYVRVKNMRKP